MTLVIVVTQRRGVFLKPNLYMVKRKSRLVILDTIVVSMGIIQLIVQQTIGNQRMMQNVQSESLNASAHSQIRLSLMRSTFVQEILQEEGF
jgi:hypothetical protein